MNEDNIDSTSGLNDSTTNPDNAANPSLNAGQATGDIDAAPSDTNNAPTRSHNAGQQTDWNQSPYLEADAIPPLGPDFTTPQQSSGHEPLQVNGQQPVSAAPATSPNHGTTQTASTQPPAVNRYQQPQAQPQTPANPPAPNPAVYRFASTFTTPEATTHSGPTPAPAPTPVTNPATAGNGRTNVPPHTTGYVSPQPAYPTGGQPAYLTPARPERWNALCIIGFILAFFIPIAGFVLSIIALIQINRTHERSKGLSIAGIIISAFRLILNIILIVVFFFALTASSNHDPSYDDTGDDCGSYSRCDDSHSHSDQDDDGDEDSHHGEDDNNYEDFDDERQSSWQEAFSTASTIDAATQYVTYYQVPLHTSAR
jgi:hypothetical protein